MTSRLAIFDIDGTLTATNEVDDECFLCAVAEVFDLPRAATLDWSAAPHVTDSALARWLSQEHRGRPPLLAALDAAALPESPRSSGVTIPVAARSDTPNVVYFGRRGSH